MKSTRRSNSEHSFGFGNKRGDVTTILFILVFLFIASMGSLIFHYTWSKLGDAVQPAFNSSTANVSNASGKINIVMEKTTAATNMLDYVFLVIFIGSTIGIIVTSFLIQTHPAFFIFFIIVMSITVILAVVFSNTYETLEEKSIFNETISKFPMTSFIMDNLPVWIIAMTGVSILVIFAKSRYKEESGGYYG